MTAAWEPVGSIRGPQGPQGPTGPQGPVGPPGSGEGGSGFKHLQQEASTVWDIEHSLGYDPAGVFVRALNGDVWLPITLTYPTSGQIARLTFPTTIAGTAWVS